MQGKAFESSFNRVWDTHFRIEFWLSGGVDGGLMKPRRSHSQWALTLFQTLPHTPRPLFRLQARLNESD
jgi:hypothetical protein